jgi:hypothetical protein
MHENQRQRSALAIPLETANKNKGLICHLQEQSTFSNAIMLGAIPQSYRRARSGTGEPSVYYRLD